MRHFILVALFGTLVLAFTACESGSISTPSSEHKPVGVVESPPPSPWYVSTSTNEVTAEVTVVATTGFGGRTIVVRQIGKKLECYLKTGQFLETIENIETNRSVVKYRFDDGPIVSQGWNLSSDNEGLFYPGDPTAFLNNMRKAKRLAIEYKPADIIPQTVSFDVSQFPVLFSDRLAVKASHAPDELKKRYTPDEFRKLCAAWQAEYDAGIQDAAAANVMIDKLESNHCPAK